MSELVFRNDVWMTRGKRLPAKVSEPAPTVETPAPGWATRSEFSEGLTVMPLPNRSAHRAGVVLDSSDPRNVLVDGSDVHKLIIGGTGSGKSRRIIMESILTLVGTDEIAIVHDPKGEAFRMTGPVMAADGFSVRTLDLRNPRGSSGWNPFAWMYELYSRGTVDSRDKAFEMMASIAVIVCPILNKDDIYWEASAQFLIAGLGWEVLKNAKCAEDVSFFEIFDLCNSVFSTEYSRDAFRQRIRDDKLQAMMIEPVLTNADNTRRCILSVAQQHLLPFVQSASVVDMLSRNDTMLKDIVKGKTIVYIISPEEKAGLNPIVSIFVRLLYEYILDTAYMNGKGTIDHTVHFMLDEFGNLPYIDNFSGMLTASRSRNIRYVITLQSLNQLDDVYQREANTIKGNCLCWMFMSSRDLSTLNEVSMLAGEDRIRHPLITPTELQRLRKESGEVLVLRDRKGPYMARLSDISAFGIDDSQATPVVRTPEPEFRFVSMVPQFTGLLSTPKHPVKLTSNDIRMMQEFCDFIGFRGDAEELVDIVREIATTCRYQETYDCLRRRGYLRRRDFGDEVRDALKPVRAKFGFLRVE